MAKLNIIVGTHGHFGEELVKSAELITGKMEGVRTLSLLPEMSFEDFMKNAEEVLSTTEKPYVVLVDLFGGTPCNVLTVLSKKYNYDIVSGVNPVSYTHLADAHGYCNLYTVYCSIC